MIQDTLDQVREKIEHADSIKDESKKELIRLLTVLQSEVERLSETDSEHAESIAGLARTSTHEAIRKEKKPRLSELSLNALAESVHGFENSHPTLFQTVNAICVALSNLGI
jgi:phage I-like protein